MITITSINYPNYLKLAKKTVPNKVEYCNMHGYEFIHEDKNFRGDVCLGYEKIWHLMKLCEDPNREWIMFLGCDTLITNFNKKIEDIIGYQASHIFLLITTDGSGVNADSFILRNTLAGRRWLEFIWNKRSEWNTEYPYEQGAMWKYNQQFGDGIRILPQRSINSYDYKEDGIKNWHRDQLGNYGGWQRGDFLVHWPCRTLNERLELFEKYNKLIQR